MIVEKEVKWEVSRAEKVSNLRLAGIAYRERIIDS